MQTKKEDSTFPIFDDEATYHLANRGLTKREYFAAQAMQGILSSSRYYYGNIPAESVATDAKNMADELIKALNTPDENNDV